MTFTFNISSPIGTELILRPLLATDSSKLASFLQNLSSQTRHFYNLDSYDLKMAANMCKSIDKYDKLRFVAHYKNKKEIIALLEFSLDIPPNDFKRYQGYGITLTDSDIRFGPCIADNYQNEGIGTRLFPFIKDVARQFGKNRIILWGGVMVENSKALHFYQKLGFRQVGHFRNESGENVDMILEI